MTSLDMLFKNPIMIISCLVMMIVLSWQLTVFVLVLLPIAGWIMGRVGKRLKRVSLEGQNQWGVMLSNIEETIGGLRIVKAFNAEGKVRHRFEGENEKFRSIQTRMNRRYVLAHPMSEFLGTLTIAIVLWFGGTLILGGHSSITAPKFIYYLVVFYSIINPAKDLSKAAYSIQRGLASMERIDKILSAENPIKNPEHPVPLTGIQEGIQYKDVRFRYGDAWVIDGVSLDIKRTAQFDNKSTLQFVIRDNGIGISEEFLPRLFETFAQEEISYTNKYGSSGLGLAITKNIIEMMNGTIDVESEKGKGTAFTVTVTLTDSDSAERLPAPSTADTV